MELTGRDADEASTDMQNAQITRAVALPVKAPEAPSRERQGRRWQPTVIGMLAGLIAAVLVIVIAATAEVSTDTLIALSSAVVAGLIAGGVIALQRQTARQFAVLSALRSELRQHRDLLGSTRYQARRSSDILHVKQQADREALETIRVALLKLERSTLEAHHHIEAELGALQDSMGADSAATRPATSNAMRALLFDTLFRPDERVIAMSDGLGDIGAEVDGKVRNVES